MYSICRILVFSNILAVGTWAIASGQAFENTNSLLVSGGISIPTTDIGSMYGTGPFGLITYRLPATQTIHIGLETGVTGPSSDVSGLELLQIPLRLMAIIPVAGEAASTPYFALGGGATINSVSAKDTSDGKSSTKVYPTYVFQLGYTLRPESMANTVFDVYIRYAHSNSSIIEVIFAI